MIRTLLGRRRASDGFGQSDTRRSPLAPESPEQEKRKTRRVIWLLGLSLLIAWSVAAPAYLGWQARRLTIADRTIRTALQETKSETSTLRQDVDDVLAEVDKLRKDVDVDVEKLKNDVVYVASKLPPSVPAIVSKVKNSIVTVEVSGVGQGSGFAIDVYDIPAPYETAILTSEHVVHEATFQGGPTIYVSQGASRYPAELWNWDEANDLAMLYINEYLPALDWASYDGHKPRTGDFVVALGSPYGLEGSTTVGVVSKVLTDYLQTDAAINPGNSGGPLLNRFGEVLAVNNYGLIGAENINFSVRIERACSEILDCS